MSSLNCKGKLLNLSTPKIMGILNLTPDSFFKGSRTNEREVIKRVEQMLNDGADIIDLGGYSTRPGAADVSIDEEVSRVIPAIKLLIKNFPDIILSIDTFRSKIAQIAIDQGASIINDVSAGAMDAKMFDLIANINVPYILMHNRGTPKTMQSHTQYKNPVAFEVLQELQEKVFSLRERGVNDLLIDPGFGFAKTTDQNFKLLKNLKHLKELNVPILVGISRKSMIYKSLNSSPEQALNGTTALHMIALEQGASILRVHDVKEARECILLHEKLQQS